MIQTVNSGHQKGKILCPGNDSCCGTILLKPLTVHIHISQIQHKKLDCHANTNNRYCRISNISKKKCPMMPPTQRVCITCHNNPSPTLQSSFLSPLMLCLQLSVREQWNLQFQVESERQLENLFMQYLLPQLPKEIFFFSFLFKMSSLRLEAGVYVLVSQHSQLQFLSQLSFVSINM